VGVKPSPDAKELLHLMTELPSIVSRFNPAITLIGVISLAIMFGWSFVSHPQLKLVPAPLLVLLVAVPLGLYFGLDDKHTLTWGGQEFTVGPNFLVDVNTKPFSMFDAITFPDFSRLVSWVGLQYVLMFALVGSLETLLSAQAIDLLDPWHRKTDMGRDLLMVGIVNTAVASIGGLPMISEIVRSKANIDAGARTRYANMFHGLFLFAFVAFLPFLIHEIPNTALAAMLIYTGFRLASPQEFVNTFLIGWEQLVIFLSTIIVTLLTDLLVGIAAGIAVKMMIHCYHGVPLRSLFLPVIDVTKLDDHKYLVEAKDSAVFTNWLAFKHQLMELGLIQQNNLVVDMSGTVLVDHTVMENLHTLEREFELNNLKLEVIGFEGHQAISEHKASARYKSAAKVAETLKAKEESKSSAK
jgi:MFS superfamily sulfate permease-like transporter